MKKFELKTELKTIKALNGLLNEWSDNFTEKELIEQTEVGILDPSNVVMIIAKSEEAKSCLRRFTDKSQKPNIPELRYHEQEKGKAKVSVLFLSRVIKIFDCYNESVEINTAKDFPITLEDEHFRVILAPRVET